MVSSSRSQSPCSSSFPPTGNATNLLSVSANTTPETSEALSPSVPDTSKPFAQAKDATKAKPSEEVFLEYLVQGIYNSEILNNQDYYGNIWADYTVDNDGKVKVTYKQRKTPFAASMVDSAKGGFVSYCFETDYISFD